MIIEDKSTVERIAKIALEAAEIPMVIFRRRSLLFAIAWIMAYLITQGIIMAIYTSDIKHTMSLKALFFVTTGSLVIGLLSSGLTAAIMPSIQKMTEKVFEEHSERLLGRLEWIFLMAASMFYPTILSIIVLGAIIMFPINRFFFTEYYGLILTLPSIVLYLILCKNIKIKNGLVLGLSCFVIQYFIVELTITGLQVMVGVLS